MFGQQNDKPEDNKIPEHSIDGALKDEDSSQDNTQKDSSNFQHPGTPLDADNKQADETPSSPKPEVITPEVSHHEDTNQTSEHQNPNAGSPENVSTDELIDIKQKALSQLTPLVGHLDQSPEDKFRTTMMMIQASDDQSLVQSAYDSAQAIEDEKTRAQALLDIVNEINYFTQHAGK